MLLIVGLARAQTAAPIEEGGNTAESGSAVELDAVVISGSRTDAAKRKVQEIPGNASLITSEDVERGRNRTLADVLAFQPGVVVEDVGGSDSVKISIRGSGIIGGGGSSAWKEGIKFLFDGLPITSPGGTSFELLSGQGVANTEVLRGGNAFDLGALSIGGAVNFITHSGHTAPGTRVRLEAGSWDLRKAAVSHGGVKGDWDYYFNADHYESTGYRSRWSKAESKGLVANVGYRFSPKLTARAIYRYREAFSQFPGSLTLSQLYDDPRQVAAANINSNSARRTGSHWGGLKVNYAIDDKSDLEVGLSIYDVPHINGEPYAANPGFWNWVSSSQAIRYSRVDHWHGHESRTNISYNGTVLNAGQALNVKGSDNSFVNHRRTFKGSHDRSLSVGNDFAITPDLWLTSGLAFTSVRRKTVYKYHATLPNLPSIDYQSYNWLPRIGVRYALSPNLQVFGNITRQIDPPMVWRSSINSRTSELYELKEQKANTFEIGIKGEVGIASGSLALYRSHVRNDLLTVVDEEETALQGGVIQTRTLNADSPTRRQGVELALNLRVWRGEDGSQVVWRNAYSWNDFRFVNDPRLGNNHLTGQPRQIYEGKLQYDHASGFYASVSTKAVDGAPIDYTNTAYAPGYVIFGAGLGYEPPGKGWKAYLDFKNLTDHKYVVTSGSTYDAAGNRDRQTYAPGDGFGVFGGVEFKF